MNVTFKINGQDIAPVLSTFDVIHKPEYSKIVKTRDGEEHPIGLKYRTYIYFSLWPSAEYRSEDERALSKYPYEVEFTDAGRGIHVKKFRLDGQFKKSFALTNLYGNNMYKNGQIVLKALRCDDA